MKVKKPAYHKPLYPKCDSCVSSRYVNYIGQIQRGMRMFTCSRCKLVILTWGPTIKKPRLPRDSRGRTFLLTDEMGDGND